MLTFLRNLRDDEHGVSAVEYGLVAAFIALVIIVAVKAVGTNLSSIFNNVATSI